MKDTNIHYQLNLQDLSIPKCYKEISTLILLPSLSFGKLFILEAKNAAYSIRTAPSLADSCFPQIIEAEGKTNLLISPFIGSDGINYLVRLLLEHSSIQSVLFIGSCLDYLHSDLEHGNQAKIGSILAPSHYSVPTSANSDDVTNDIRGNSILRSFSFNPLAQLLEKSPSEPPISLLKGLSCVHTLNPQTLKVEVDASIPKEYSHFIEMESASIANICIERKIPFWPLLIVTDQYIASTHEYSPPNHLNTKSSKQLLRVLFSQWAKLQKTTI